MSVTRACRKRAVLSPGWRQNAPMADNPSLADQLAQSERLRPVLEAVPQVEAGQSGVYLVGGTVRDLLLGEPGFDIDLAVEGDGQAFARALAAELGGRATAHDAFRPAAVEDGGGEHADVVTARPGRYESPAPPPLLGPPTIEGDLLPPRFPR